MILVCAEYCAICANHSKVVQAQKICLLLVISALSRNFTLAKTTKVLAACVFLFQGSFCLVEVAHLNRKVLLGVTFRDDCKLY